MKRDGQREILPVLTPTAAAQQAAYQARSINTEAANTVMIASVSETTSSATA